MTSAAKFAGNGGDINRTIGTQTDMIAIHVAEFAGPVLNFMD